MLSETGDKAEPMRRAPFRWINCYADVEASSHGPTILSYLDDVIRPALATLDGLIAALGRSSDPADMFKQSDLEDVRRETALAFGLSIQSIWERQLRSYLTGCANVLCPLRRLEARIEKGSWRDLLALFAELRGIRLQAFPSFAVLDTLQHLGNACRHGDGPSSIELLGRCPDLWPCGTEEWQARVAAMDVSMGRLEEFARAIAAFWSDAGYIYRESIVRKDPGLEARLQRERLERAWLPQADERP